MKTKHYLIVIVIIVVLAGLWWWLTQKQTNNTEQQTNQEQAQNNQTEDEPEVVAPPATNQLASDDSIAVSDQAIASTAITVDNLNISKPSFVAIVIPGTNGKADQIIGNSGLLTPGVKQDFEVMLKSGFKLNTTTEYTAVIYNDDGDKKFDSSKDTKVSGPASSTTFSAE